MKKKSTIQNIVFAHEYMLKENGIPYYWGLTLFISVMSISIFFAEVHLPAFVIKKFQDLWCFNQVIIYVLCYLFCLVIVDIIVKRMERNLNKQICNTRMLRARDYYALGLKLDYETVDTASYRLKFEKGIDSYYDGFHMGFHHILIDCRTLLTSIIGLLVFIVYSSNISVAMTLIIFGTSWITLYLYSKNNQWLKENEDKRQKIDLKMKNIFRDSLSLKNAKDIRFYSLLSLFSNEFEKLDARRKEWVIKEAKKTYTVKFVERTLALFKMLLLFYVIFHSPDVTAEEAIILIGLMMGMEKWLKNIFDSLKFLHRNAINVFNTREVLELEPKKMLNPVGENRKLSSPSIEFINVSFSFQETGVQVFKNFNLKISYGEKIAIVGNNGAGKTTLIKLLCGLYKPTEGKILLDGVDLQSIPRSVLFEKLSAVFQDFSILAASIAENISCTDDFNVGKIDEVIAKVGLAEKVKSLSDGVFTEMTKEIFSDGILLSRGETQKILMARCLYKDSPIVILDEPTAALDAIAENEWYERYSLLFNNKTVLFISHRLSSTKFCDRIIMLHKGVIEEEGTHDELLNKNGRYAQMYKLQSSYYEG